jgi:hypothetical protein
MSVDEICELIRTGYVKPESVQEAGPIFHALDDRRAEDRKLWEKTLIAQARDSAEG